MRKFKNVVGIRLNEELVEKLDQLASRTARGRGDVMRLLISAATIADTPDLTSAPVTPAAVGVNEDH